MALAKEEASGGKADPAGEKAGAGPQLIGMRRYAKAVRPREDSAVAALAGGGEGKKPRIALITAVGTIVRGVGDPTARSPQIGGDAVAAAVRRAYSDPLVKAIVVRVDSPGGSAVASDTIRRELARAREAGLPVVVSMAGVAASGGYYIATGADKIVAQPGTITGSIGCAANLLPPQSHPARPDHGHDSSVITGRARAARYDHGVTARSRAESQAQRPP